MLKTALRWMKSPLTQRRQKRRHVSSRLPVMDYRSPDPQQRTSRGAASEKDKSGAAGKGLRHFSMKVCEKVETKGRTTYNEVADELVAEFSAPDYACEQQFDEKNIRRRVYDALNVLMAMNIITKEKKDITWQGLPNSADADAEALKAELARTRQKCDKKVAHLSELVDQHDALKQLLARNAAARARNACPSVEARLALPFILVQTRVGSAVDVQMTRDSQLVHIDFNNNQFGAWRRGVQAICSDTNHTRDQRRCLGASRACALIAFDPCF